MNIVHIPTPYIKMVKMISDGYTTSEIANKLKVNERTLEGRIASLKKRYECENITHLACKFLRLGIIK